MSWITFAIKPHFGWPNQDVEVTYLGNTFLLRPETDDEEASVSLQVDSLRNYDNQVQLVRRFLSILSWIENAGIEEISYFGKGGNKPIKVGKCKIKHIQPEYSLDYLPELRNEKQKIALAIYREASSVNSIAYKFLGFYKIINLLFNSSKDQMKWINDNIVNVKNYHAKKSLSNISASDLGNYLFVQGRCAIAHAYADPLIDPDKNADLARLESELPLIKELARIAIERELGVATKSSHKKLLELNGFAQILGKDAVEKICNNEHVDLNYFDFPQLSIKIKKCSQKEMLKYIKVISFESRDGIIILNCETIYIKIMIKLDFKNWKLIFEPECGFTFKDDKSSNFALAASDFYEYLVELYNNGQMEIYNANTGDLMGRASAFLPVAPHFSDVVNYLDRISQEYKRLAKERETTSDL